MSHPAIVFPFCQSAILSAPGSAAGVLSPHPCLPEVLVRRTRAPPAPPSPRAHMLGAADPPVRRHGLRACILAPTALRLPPSCQAAAGGGGAPRIWLTAQLAA
ncbi:MAG: hypothetical protein J3K34DRAFT_517780 [Monoraphidium minutum]|nr:MAG: hypothetical protein J3K34DRAFT_517780 [Monoraphidium minutum]